MQKHIMMILTEACNLNCVYCYEHYKTNNKMSWGTAKEIIDRELNSECDSILFEFFGGEPFLEFELIKKIHSYIFSKAVNKKILCFATTNGTLVHGAIKE